MSRCRNQSFEGAFGGLVKGLCENSGFVCCCSLTSWRTLHVRLLLHRGSQHTESVASSARRLLAKGAGSLKFARSNSLLELEIRFGELFNVSTSQS